MIIAVVASLIEYLADKDDDDDDDNNDNCAPSIKLNFIHYIILLISSSSTYIINICPPL